MNDHLVKYTPRIFLLKYKLDRWENRGYRIRFRTAEIEFDTNKESPNACGRKFRGKSLVVYHEYCLWRRISFPSQRHIKNVEVAMDDASIRRQK